MDQVRCILLDQIVNVTDVNSDIILKVCKKLGFNFNKKSKIQKTLIIKKVRLGISRIINEFKTTGLKNNIANYATEIKELNKNELVEKCVTENSNIQKHDNLLNNDDNLDVMSVTNMVHDEFIDTNMEEINCSIESNLSIKLLQNNAVIDDSSKNVMNNEEYYVLNTPDYEYVDENCIRVVEEPEITVIPSSEKIPTESHTTMSNSFITPPKKIFNMDSCPTSQLWNNEKFIAASNINTKDFFVTPSRKNILSKDKCQKRLFCDDEVISRPEMISLLRNKGELRGLDISPVKSPLKRLRERNLNICQEFGLPKGTINVSPKSLRSKYEACNFKEGVFFIPPEEWKQIYINGKLDIKTYPMVFRKYLESINNTCILYIKKKFNANKKGEIKINVYCKMPDCKVMRLFVTPSNGGVEVVVWSSSRNFSHSPKDRMTCQIRGHERKIIGDKLKNTTAFKYQDECILSASPTKVLRSGNMQSVKTLTTLRKLSSEQQLKADYDKHDSFDVVLMAQEEKNKWLNMIVNPYPFNVKWTSDYHLLILQKLSKSGKFKTLHIDATGSLVRPPNEKKETIYYYAAIVQIDKIENICPVTEMISSTHDRLTIESWLTSFKEKIINEVGLSWPPFKNVVTDFSWAFMHGISKAWNNKNNIFEYLDLCHQVLTKKNVKFPDNDVVVSTCSNHYIKNVIKHAKTIFDDESKAYYVSKCVGLVFDMDNYEEIKNWFRLLSRILLSKNVTPLCNSARAEMNFLFKGNKVLKLEEMDLKDHVVNPLNEKPYYAECKKSAFYYDFKEILDAVYIEISNTVDDQGKNDMYSETYMLHFLIENIPYIPLWSRVITAKIGLEKRQSNATAESWFNIIKNHVLGNQRKMKCGRFIEKTSARVTAIWSRCGLIIPKNVLAIRPKNNANNDDELHLNDKEFWLKKGKKPSNLVNLGTILRPQKSMNTFKNTKSISENDKTNEVLNRKFVSEVSVQKDIEPSEDIGNAHYSSTEILNVDCINETLDLVEKYKNDDTNKDSSVISYGHTVVWEPSGDESPVGKYKMYRTSNLIKDGLYYMHGYPGCKNYIVARMSFGNETVEISSEDFKHLDTKGENNELWLENKEIWCLLQICLKRSERTWVKQKQQMLGCMSPDISYYMINLGKRIEPPNENGKIEGMGWIEFSRVLIPLLENNSHWTLMLVDFTKKKIN
ncbi:uncharacterized protein LOC126909632 isoform X2 [Daktulosphaira vitifoliae]|uniref:uncharacterized protein LOC126909632 isoform X2 n=1 Tax=Daktulosphaira vitifoliae TaxID=58002 RepID=UPI0021AABB24|nr:uncharacterized protein LOC126909632 isoform X2 [Daktulosphaira vitifoliae]